MTWQRFLFISLIVINIKLTELETNAKNQMAQQQVERAHWQWIVPVAISIIAIVVTLFEVIYRIK